MLDTVGNYHCMQFQGKLRNQTWENAKKPSFGPSFGPNSGRCFFSSKVCLRQPLDIMVSYHHVQYQKNLLIQSWENLKADRRTDGQTDESNFIGRCPTNVERPKVNITIKFFVFKLVCVSDFVLNWLFWIFWPN